MRESTPGPIQLIWTQPPPPPRQRALGREEIVAAAIALADEAGLGAMTMKAIAVRLGDYSPMALYRYVHNKEGLVDLMLDAATAEIPLPARPGGDWRSDLYGLAMDSRRMTHRHPWYAQLVHTRPPAGPHMMRRLEFMLTVLTGEGATVAAAMTYAALVDRHILGSGLQEAEEARLDRRYGLDDTAKLVAAIRALHGLAVADGGVPHLAGWLAQPTGFTADEQFALGLDFLLDGIARRLAKPAEE
ncbi:TetR/AcrR family transcriptional regulator C-terminal domain-containing protein [Planotetraspora mira]|uniref:TetR/AcrR family transcriptional regulator C-terminal domain-containing protein n=1 Tax=Planotetraspora mira TaxID=58121 RepID=UPI0019527576|nr:TetR/AcrR family transcriptional regulator C-terminal domain-containing protein [Planotetraspora mira]